MSHPNTTFPMEYIIIVIVVAFIGFQIYKIYKLWTEKKVETKKLFNKNKKTIINWEKKGKRSFYSTTRIKDIVDRTFFIFLS